MTYLLFGHKKRTRWTGALIILLSVLLVYPSSGLAQSIAQASGDDRARTLEQELSRMRRDLDDLRNQVYQNWQSSPTQAVDSRGRGAGADNAVESSVAGRLQLKIQSIENSLRSLTGRIEETIFRLQALSDQLVKVNEDVQFRLTRLESQSLAQAGQLTGGEANDFSTTSVASGTTGPATTQSGNNTTVIPAPATPENPQISANQLATGQQNNNLANNSLLGAIVTDENGNIVGANVQGANVQGANVQGTNVQGGAATTQAPSSAQTANTTQAAPAPRAIPENPRIAYNFGREALLRRDFVLAETTFKTFLERWPQDTLAGNAAYWLGETYYADQKYSAAANAFIDTYTTYRTSPKAPDSLLKLAMSLGHLNNLSPACDALQALEDEFPDASQTTRQMARVKKQEFCQN